MDLEEQVGDDQEQLVKFREEEEEEKRDDEKHYINDNDDDSIHVLAVDDSVIDRKILEKLLTLSSYHVTCVESGDKALEYLGLVDNRNPPIDNHDHHHHDQHHHHHDHHDEANITHSSFPPSDHHEGQGTRVNLIMTDYSMPGITGYDLLKKVKGSSWKDVPVVVMSSENVPSRIHMCLKEGADDFLLKPVRLSDLKKLHPHLLKSTTPTQCCGANTSTSTSSNKDLSPESTSNLRANGGVNHDYNEVIRDLSNCFDKGKAKIEDDHLDKRVKLEGLTAIQMQN